MNSHLTAESHKVTTGSTSLNQRLSNRVQQNSKSKIADDSLKWIKVAIWVYFFLLLFEGALRKWVLPFLSTPLLVVRDPIAVYIIFMAIRRRLLAPNVILIGVSAIGVVGIFTALFIGHGNLAVAIFGARILLVHFPLIFVIGRVFNKDDVIKMGKVLLWISVPMAILITLQFYSPQSAWVNRGIGGDLGGGGFSGALGYFRPPGTFSFISGTVAFFSLAACFIFYFLLNSKLINRAVLYGAAGGLLIAIPLSISRSLFVSVVIVLLFTVIAVSRQAKYLGKVFIGLIVMGIIFIALSNTSAFQKATAIFTTRFESANEIEGGLQNVLADRFLGGMVTALQSSSEQPFFGYGIGMGTNVGSMLLSGKVTYLIAEGEWGRLIGELGPLMGVAIIFFRLQLCVVIGLAAFKKLKEGNLLPWILLSFVLLTIPQGQWAQPTVLGFSVLAGGLTIAALKNSGVRS